MQTSRTFPSRKQAGGFTYLELVIVIAIIAGLLYFAIDRLLKLQVVAERAAMEQIIGQLQSSIALTISDHIVNHDIPGLRKYVSTNPMDLLADTPINYQGSFPNDPGSTERATWWYDQSKQVLVYRVANFTYLATDSPDKDNIKFKILPVYDDINRNRRFDRSDVLTGLRLQATHPYRWHNEPVEMADYMARDRFKK